MVNNPYPVSRFGFYGSPLFLVGLICMAILAGCDGQILSFGTEIEKSGSAIGAAEFAEIELRTSTQLPPGTVGIEYYYNGSGIDDYLAAKLKIDPIHLTEAKAIVEQLPDTASAVPSGWADWLVISPADVVLNRKGEWSPFNYGESVLTQENGAYFLYLVWFTI